jgi:2,3-dihydroxybiphenyl 1,2-dioxygenase
MSLVQQLGYVGTTTTDLAAWREFATEVLGVEITPDSDDERLHLRIDEHHHRFTIHAGDVDDVAYVGWEVADPAALEGVAADLAAAGIAAKAGTSDEVAARCVLDLVWFECPHTGVRTELFVGPEVQFLPRFRPSRAISGFRTGAEGMGHVVLYAPDLAAAEQFYVEVLGFATTDRVIVPGMGQLAACLHCNTRHHSLGLMAIPGTPRRMQHVMLETADIDDVGTTYDLCVERGITSTTLGRHLNDRAFSFYFATPSGWHVEYGWGPRSIDPATWHLEHFNGIRPKGEWGHDGLFTMI